MGDIQIYNFYDQTVVVVSRWMATRFSERMPNHIRVNSVIVHVLLWAPEYNFDGDPKTTLPKTLYKIYIYSYKIRF